MSILKIKRSGTTGSPPALAQAELAYSYLTGTQSNGGDRLYIGTGTETGGVAANIEVIGGKYFTEKLDHVPGTLTANSAIITDSNNKIDQILVDNLSIDGNSITSTDTNGNIVLSPNGSGTIQLDGPVTFANTVSISGQATLDSLAVTDLTETRIVYVGVSGELVDSVNLTFDGTRVTTSNITVTGETNTSTLVSVSAQISDLTLSTNTIATANNLNLSLLPDGTGNVDLAGSSRIIGVEDPINSGDVVTLNYLENTYTSSLSYAADVGTDTLDLRTQTLAISGNTGITTTVTDNQIDIDLNDTAVTPGTYGSTTSIPTFTVDQQGRITGASNVDVATVLNIGGDTGTDDVNLLSETLTFNGNTGITVAVANNQVDIDLDDTSIVPGTYGSATQIGIFTVDQQGRLTSATETEVGTSLSVTGDTGSDSISFLTETLNFQGGTGVTTTITNNNLEVEIGQDVSTTANVIFQDIEATGDVIVSGDLVVNGSTTSVNVDNLNIEDALIRLASNNSTDVVDIGFVGSYNNGANDEYAGFFRDASDGEFYVFESYEDIDLLDNVIDRASPSFNLGVMNASIYRFDNITLQLTGDIAGSVSFSDIGSSNLTIATTVQPDSVALGTDTTGDYVQSFGVTAGTGLSVSGSGEGAVVTLSGVDATTTGTKGVSTYDATNFNTSSGLVTIDTVDGGTY